MKIDQSYLNKIFKKQIFMFVDIIFDNGNIIFRPKEYSFNEEVRIIKKGNNPICLHKRAHRIAHDYDYGDIDTFVCRDCGMNYKRIIIEKHSNLGD